MNNQIHSSSAVTRKMHWPARIPILVMPWIIVRVLFATNIITLLSDQAQSTEHETLVAVVKALSPDSFDVISRLKSHPAMTAEMKKADDMVKQNMTLTERRKVLESTIARLQLENS